MTLYVDTSVLVAALTREAETLRVQAWLSAQPAGGLAISAWVATEFSAALAIKLRTGEIDKAHRTNALATFAALSQQSFTMLGISAGTFRTATLLCDQAQLALRAGDALHLAVCAEHGSEFCTLDRPLAKAGPALGIKTTLL